MATRLHATPAARAAPPRVPTRDVVRVRPAALPPRRWAGEVRRLFRDYPHQDDQLRLLGIPKPAMVEFLWAGLRPGDGQLFLAQRPDGLDGLMQATPQPDTSRCLGRQVWQVRHLVHGGDPSTAARLAAATARAVRDQAEVLLARVPASDVAAAQGLESEGYRFVACELTGLVDLDAVEVPDVPGFRVVPMKEEHVREVAAIARRTHQQNRFFLDPRFDPRRALELYAELILTYSRDPATRSLVAVGPGGRVAGFLCVRWSPGLEAFCGRRYASLDFIGVHPDFRDAGVGALLDREGVRRLRRGGAVGVTVRTLSTNLRALAILRKIGFRVSSSTLLLHRWF